MMWIGAVAYLTGFDEHFFIFIIYGCFDIDHDAIRQDLIGTILKKYYANSDVL